MNRAPENTAVQTALAQIQTPSAGHGRAGEDGGAAPEHSARAPAELLPQGAGAATVRPDRGERRAHQGDAPTPRLGVGVLQVLQIDPSRWSHHLDDLLDAGDCQDSIRPLQLCKRH